MVFQEKLDIGRKAIEAIEAIEAIKAAETAGLLDCKTFRQLDIKTIYYGANIITYNNAGMARFAYRAADWHRFRILS
jgi:type II restriction/modification system DNA methylase subunit YeeA